jgi:hypothetical protein
MKTDTTVAPLTMNDHALWEAGAEAMRHAMLAMLRGDALRDMEAYSIARSGRDSESAYFADVARGRTQGLILRVQALHVRPPEVKS